MSKKKSTVLSAGKDTYCLESVQGTFLEILKHFPYEFTGMLLNEAFFLIHPDEPNKLLEITAVAKSDRFALSEPKEASFVNLLEKADSFKQHYVRLYNEKKEQLLVYRLDEDRKSVV